ncbi:hypothetical protein B0H16DRAFT_1850467 [Mycena metata]|uniref:Uncharacterized protein n=1 Tax=Mycena metata TaxID=1033252 RepID=A0AAD7DK66_9AGAR|nr:hypothetical protein B0H16DRAFT_1850467 [Mycena metata]
MSTSMLIAAPDDPELEISTKIADYFEALYAEEENNRKPRGSLLKAPGTAGRRQQEGWNLASSRWLVVFHFQPTDDESGQSCPCDGIPTADNSRDLGGPLLTRPSLVLPAALPELTTGPQAPTRQCQCANPNWRSSTSSQGWHNSELLGAKMCDACGYERRHHNHPPPSLQVRHMPMHPPTHYANVNCGKSIVG